MTLENSLEAPRDFKQCRNEKQRQSQKPNSGKRSNLADELLECISQVDTNEFVQQVCKVNGKMPNFICFTENQKEDTFFFLPKSGHPLWVDRTFNLGCYYVTTLVYKNIRVFRSDDPNIHPITLGPIFIHRDATFETYDYSFTAIKGALCESLDAFEISLGKDIYIGSDDEKALTKAMESNFPAAHRFLCTKHLKDNTTAYMQKEVGIHQKERKSISKLIFGENGIVTADSSFSFDKKSAVVLKTVSKFPKFAEYFRKRLKPTLENYVNTACRKAP